MCGLKLPYLRAFFRAVHSADASDVISSNTVCEMF